MSQLKILAGDFAKIDTSFFTYVVGMGSFSLYMPGKFKSERISITEVESLDIASEESVKKIGGAIGLGLAGAVLFGPLGLVAGALAGGNSKQVVFICQFKDGRKLMASTDQKTFTSIQAALMDAPKQLEIEIKAKEKEEAKAKKKAEKAVNLGFLDKDVFSIFKKKSNSQD